MTDFDDLFDEPDGLDQEPTPEPTADETVEEPPPPQGLSPAVRAAVRDAEAAGQRSACGLARGDELPEDLELALELRVEINLATTGGHPIVSMAGGDSAVIDLEAPYRKPRPAPAGPDEQPPAGSLDTTTEEE